MVLPVFQISGVWADFSIYRALFEGTVDSPDCRMDLQKSQKVFCSACFFKFSSMRMVIVVVAMLSAPFIHIMYHNISIHLTAAERQILQKSLHLQKIPTLYKNLICLS